MAGTGMFHWSNLLVLRMRNCGLRGGPNLPRTDLWLLNGRPRWNLDFTAKRSALFSCESVGAVEVVLGTTGLGGVSG